MACATNRTLAKVNSSLITARQPSVPNVIAIGAYLVVIDFNTKTRRHQDSAKLPRTSCLYGFVLTLQPQRSSRPLGGSPSEQGSWMYRLTSPP